MRCSTHGSRVTHAIELFYESDSFVSMSVSWDGMRSRLYVDGSANPAAEPFIGVAPRLLRGDRF